MKFSKFAKYLSRLEETPKRLEITAILAEMIKELEPDETDIAVRLACGYLRASYESVKFNIADKMMIRAIAQAFDADPEQISKKYGKEGDLGSVVTTITTDSKPSSKELTLVYQQLLEVAQSEGSGSQDQKTYKVAKILNDIDSLSARYITRIILGTTRLGFTELTVVAALAVVVGDKESASKIEAVYNIRPDIGLIAKAIRKHGLKGLSKISLEAGIPVLSQKAQRVSGMEEAVERIPNSWVEFKFDGTRVQLHLDRNKLVKDNKFKQSALFDSNSNKFLLKTYTRNLEETTHQYPDIAEAADKQISADSIILDGEAIGFNKDTGEFLPFQETIQRKRKHGVAEAVANIPLKYFVFDILYLNGKSVIDLPLRERRKLIDKAIMPGDIIIPAEHFDITDRDMMTGIFEEAKDRQLEGLIVKNPEDPYQAGARSYSWIKLKKADEKLLADSVECVVLGYYYGKGVRSKFGIGGFLVGVYDKKTDSFRTVSKIGTGLKEDDWVKLKTLADKVKTSEKPNNVEVAKNVYPDVWTKPVVVVEIGADEITISPMHTAGYALRFPRLLKFREDKSPIETTTVTEIVDMYKKQKK